MPITGMDRMPGAGLARGTLFDKELNVTEIDVPDLTVRSSLILQKSGEFQYNIIWTSPTGAARDLSIPGTGANDDTFTLLALAQTMTNKTLSTGTAITAGTITGVTDIDLAVGNRTLFDTVGANTLTFGAGGTTVSIPGNLTVSGTTTTVNTTTLNVADNMFLMNSDFTGSATQDSGLVIERGDDTNVAIVWDESADQFIFTTTNNAGAGNDVTPIAYANVQLANLAVAQIGAFSLTGKLTAGSTEIEGTGFDIDGGDVSAITVSGGLTWNAAQNLNSQAFTGANIDSGDINTNVVINKSPTITLGGDLGGSLTLTALAGGTLTSTIQATAVEGSMLNTNAISGQTALESGLASGDELFISDAGTLKRMDISVLDTYRAAVSETLTGKSIDFGTNTLTGSVAEFNAALQSESFATLTGSEALSNKTLTTPIISSTGFTNAQHAHAANDSGGVIALGTATSGNYVATITGGTGITSSAATSGEGTTHSLSIDASQGQITTVGALDAGSITSGFTSIDVGSGNITTTGTVSAGNLTVTGTTTTVNSTVMTVVDPIINLQTASGGGAIASDSNKDVGLAMHYHTGSAAKIAFLGFDDTDSKLMYIPDATLSSEVVSGSVGIIKANLEGSAATLTTGRTIGMTGDVVWTSASFTGAGNVTATSAIQGDVVTFAKMQNVAANSVLGRNANSSGDLSEIALATTQILIGDGTGFTAAALSGDATMTNAGVVSIGATKVTGAMLNDDAVSAQTELTSGIATTDELLISDNGVLSRMDVSVLNTYRAAVSETLTGKSIDLASNPLTGSIAEFNTALQSESFATLGGTETLVAKSLTTPTISSTGFANANHAHAASNSGGTIANITGTAAIATTVTITDNENTAENNALIFTAGGDLDGGNLGLESDGDLHYNPSTGTLTSTIFAGAFSGTVTNATNVVAVANSENENQPIALLDNASGTAQPIIYEASLVYNPSTTTLTVPNLTVSGTTTSVSTTDLAVEDEIIMLAAEQTSGTNTDALDIGIASPYRVSGGTRYRGMFYDLSTTRWKFFNRTGNSDEAPGTSNIINTTSGFALGDLEVGNITGTLATVAQANITSTGTLTILNVDNIRIDGNTISSTAGTDLLITPLADQQIVLDSTIVIDAGVVTGATSITSTSFTGDLTGNISGTAPAGTLTGSTLASGVTASSLTSLGAQAANLNMNSNTVYNISQLSGSSGDGPRIAGNEASTATNPVFIPDRGTMTTGVGGTGDYVSLIEGGTETLRADGGKVTIGGITPEANLHIYTSNYGAAVNANGDELLIESSGNAGMSIASPIGSVYFGDAGANNSGVFAYRHSSDRFEWVTAGADSMYLSGGISPTLQLGLASSADSKILFDSDGTDYHIGREDAQDDLVIGTGSTLGTNPIIMMNEQLCIGFGESPAVAPRIRIYPHSTADYDTSATFLDGAASQTNTITGNQAGTYGWNLRNYTLAGDSGTRTVTDGATVYIPGAIAIGSNAAVTNNYALWVDAGNTRLDGDVGINVTTPKAALHVGAGLTAANDGQAFGSKDIVLTDAYDSTAQLAITMSNYQACYVKVFITGNWATGTHYAVAYLGEFFVQRTNNAGNEPGAIIRQIDNTHSGSMSAQIVDVDGSSSGAFLIRFKTSTSEGGETAYLNYHIMGQFDSIV